MGTVLITYTFVDADDDNEVTIVEREEDGDDGEESEAGEEVITRIKGTISLRIP